MVTNEVDRYGVNGVESTVLPSFSPSRDINRTTRELLTFLGDVVINKVKVGKVCIRAKWPIRPELIPVSVA